MPRYATPIDYASQVADEIIDTGHVVALRGSACRPRDLTDARPRSRPLRRPHHSVAPDGPAANAGLQAGDIVLALDDAPIDSSSDLVVALRSHQPGESVAITYVRDGDQQVAMRHARREASLAARC